MNHQVKQPVTHTPGPWRVDAFYNGEAVTAKDGPIADCNVIGMKGLNPAINQANARLVAAAPDLLEACKLAVGIIGNMDPARHIQDLARHIQRIIAQVEGKTNAEFVQERQQEILREAKYMAMNYSIREARLREDPDFEEIQPKPGSGPRLTPEDINDLIAHVDYHVFKGTSLTVCCIELQNGFCVTGESAFISPENFDEAEGQKISFANAREKIWQLAGYALRSKIHGV